MSKTAKTVLIVVAVLFACCACACIGSVLLAGSAGSLLARAGTTDQAKVEQIATTIADIDASADFKPGFGMKLLGFSVVGYSGSSYIILFQSPTSMNLDQASLERQLRQAMEGNQQSQQGLELEVVGDYDATIRGQEVTLTVSEGVNKDDEPYRELTGVFQGKGGPTMIFVAGPIEYWDQDAIDGFLAGIN